MRYRYLAILLLVAIPAHASPRHWYADKRWWVGEGIIALSVALDAHSSCLAVNRGVDTSIAFPSRRSCGADTGIGLGAFAAYTALHAAEWHFGHDDPSRAIRALTPWMLPAVVAPIHLSAAIHNYMLPAPPSYRVVGHIRIPLGGGGE